MIAARSSYLAGFAGTSNVEAGRRLGIPAFGTMAHSWVQAFPTESGRLRRPTPVSSPNTRRSLVDTYDTPKGVERACADRAARSGRPAR